MTLTWKFHLNRCNPFPWVFNVWWVHFAPVNVLCWCCFSRKTTKRAGYNSVCVCVCVWMRVFVPQWHLCVSCTTSRPCCTMYSEKCTSDTSSDCTPSPPLHRWDPGFLWSTAKSQGQMVGSVYGCIMQCTYHSCTCAPAGHSGFVSAVWAAAPDPPSSALLPSPSDWCTAVSSLNTASSQVFVDLCSSAVRYATSTIA